jgi:hypothetical protein
VSHYYLLPFPLSRVCMHASSPSWRVASCVIARVYVRMHQASLSYIHVHTHTHTHTHKHACESVNSVILTSSIFLLNDIWPILNDISTLLTFAHCIKIPDRYVV